MFNSKDFAQMIISILVIGGLTFGLIGLGIGYLIWG
ncbi:hypothetical protein Acj133p030 [Acinetobacter phage 133]|uniref:Uncharacterized protein n=1 Tax=Acinetobacter phage 133 TaxID=2919552 RepID=D9I5Z6_9CAUD|nr:hypothetical protein Acj133p030 [Acinetobacter phage 133]ADJ19377.1 hypothetical protein Acj133p030 [Acinetobacter phage 133]